MIVNETPNRDKGSSMCNSIRWIKTAFCAASQFVFLAYASADINLWYGDLQEVGRHGYPQDDFNLLGDIENPDSLISISYQVGDAVPVEMNFHSYRRIAHLGDFNADIPLSSLAVGDNIVRLEARIEGKGKVERLVTVRKLAGGNTLPSMISWKAPSDLQTFGQVVDGKWRVADTGIRTVEIGYDRLYLVGEQSWRDYELETQIILHDVDSKTDPISGGAGLGVILRFAGHVVGGPQNFPQSQPKWGFQPFGSICWLRWNKNEPNAPPQFQFYRGDSVKGIDQGSFAVERECPYVMKVRCETLPDREDLAVSLYSFKMWSADDPEPSAWDWSVTQESATALRSGGFALVAHHVDASFQSLKIRHLQPRQSLYTPDRVPASREAKP